MHCTHVYRQHCALYPYTCVAKHTYEAKTSDFLICPHFPDSFTVNEKAKNIEHPFSCMVGTGTPIHRYLPTEPTALLKLNGLSLLGYNYKLPLFIDY